MNYALYAIAALIVVRIVGSLIETAAHGVTPHAGTTPYQAATGAVVVAVAEAAAVVVLVIAGMRLS